MLIARGGIPQFARRLGSGDASTIVAFGTSMTLFGKYLEQVVPALSTAFRNHRIRLVNAGLRGFTTGIAPFRVADQVLGEPPDLVLIEFAHNDSTPEAIDLIAPALHGIIARIRAQFAACDFVFVYLAPRGEAVGGTTPAIRAYEEVAGYYDIPSIDLAGYCEQLAAGGAEWDPGTPTSLTIDGIHHSEYAAGVLAPPFAAALLDLTSRSANLAPVARPCPDSRLAFATRVAAHDCISGGEWSIGVPANHEGRNAEAYSDAVAAAHVPGSSITVSFAGSQVALWTLGTGSLAIATSPAGAARELRLTAASGWELRTLLAVSSPGRYTLEVSVVNLPVVLGDVFVVGKIELSSSGRRA